MSDDRNRVRPALEPASREESWRTQFPYRHESDDLVSRRGLLHFAVYNSGALFACTALVALAGAAGRRPQYEARRIVRRADVAEGEAFYFEYPGPGDQAVLLHLAGGEFAAYSQTCTHLSCSVYYQQAERRLICPCHDGVFSPLTGDAEAGPPARRLPRILLRQDGEWLVAVGVEP